MSEHDHVQRLLTFWQAQLTRLTAGKEKLTPEAQQHLDDLAAFTRQRISALKERLYQCKD